MTRRAWLGAVLPVLGVRSPHSGMDGFEVSGDFRAGSGTVGDGYYSLGQSIAIMIDPTKAPMCEEGAKALVGGQARLILTKG
jgi:hypothetical protein